MQNQKNTSSIDKATRVEQLRPVYQDLYRSKGAGFFKEQRSNCPICQQAHLKKFLQTGDVYQFKPGTFHLDECASCGLVFQNPQLTEQGLGYYYRDFYDGVGSNLMDSLFPQLDKSYRARAHALRRWWNQSEEPSLWLDVGGADGRFCRSAAPLFPKTQFVVVDGSEAVLELNQESSAIRGYRGSFPALSASLKKDHGSFHVVSMGHYLEHTSDPEREIQAAGSLLKSGGALLIDVPNPNSLSQRILGRLGYVWLQPQHLMLLPPSALSQMLTRHHFQVERIEYRQARMPLELTIAYVIAVRMLIQPMDVPWHPKRSSGSRWLARILTLLALPLMLVMRILDSLLLPLFSQKKFANSYRIIARRL